MHLFNPYDLIIFVMLHDLKFLEVMTRLINSKRVGCNSDRLYI